MLNKTYWIAALVVLLFAACVNDLETGSCSQSYNIRVSVRSGNELTRASDLIIEEKIKRYDIFIYEPGTTGTLVKYFGESGLADKEMVSVSFESSSDFTTQKDIYVVVNNAEWDSKSETEMKAITKAELQAYELTCKQNVTEQLDKITDFTGYKKSSTENEPFVMSASRTNYNFSTNGATLSMELKRTYAKVLLKFKTELTVANDPAWIDLKTIRVRAINNIPSVARLFQDDGNDYMPVCKSYVYDDGSEYELASIDANLTIGAYSFDTFSSDRLALRLFPQDPSGDNAKVTSLLVDFEVGGVGNAKITQTFKRLIKIGDMDNGYQIDPNYAYIITIAYGKTTNSIKTTCQIAPWNFISMEEEVDPD